LSELLREQVADLDGAYLFGSRALGCERRDSDWDVAFLGTSLSPLESADLRARAGMLLGADCDLVDLRRSPAALKAEVLRHGRVFLSIHPGLIERFEMRALGEYQALNDHRKAILRDLGMAA